MSEPKKNGAMPSTVSGTPPPGTTTNNEAARIHNERIWANQYRIVAQQQAGLDRMGSKASNRQRWINNVKHMQKHDPHLLDYLKKKFPQQVAEAERAIAAGTASAPKVMPKPPAPTPKAPPVRPRFGSIKAGIAGAFSAPNLASMIPEILLAVADREAAKDAIRTIIRKFLKEGFAKGVAAAATAWTDEDVRLNLKYRVTDYRVKHLHDPAGFLTRAYILQLAEACENYAVDVGFEYSFRQPRDWRLAMQKKGFSILAQRNYDFGNDPAVIFEFAFIDTLAYVLRPTTDSIAEPMIRISFS